MNHLERFCVQFYCNWATVPSSGRSSGVTDFVNYINNMKVSVVGIT